MSSNSNKINNLFLNSNPKFHNNQFNSITNNIKPLKTFSSPFTDSLGTTSIEETNSRENSTVILRKKYYKKKNEVKENKSNKINLSEEKTRILKQIKLLEKF